MGVQGLIMLVEWLIIEITDYVKWLCGCIWFSCLVNHWWLKASFSHPMQWNILYKIFRVCWTWIHCYHSKISEVTCSQFVMLFHVVSSQHHGIFFFTNTTFCYTTNTMFQSAILQNPSLESSKSTHCKHNLSKSTWK